MVSFALSPHAMLLLVAALITALLQSSSAFVITSNCNQHQQCTLTSSTLLLMSTTTVIPGTETEKRTDKLIPGDEKTPATETGGAGSKGPVEWLIDDAQLSRDDNDPFHILLLDETYVKNPTKITIEYVASSCAYVLGMPYDEAAELAAHAEKEGFSCLGTWSREECIRLGKQLQQRDLICRVVPFCEGGDRAWQARNMKDEVWEI